MPSTNQQGTGEQYRNEAHRVFETGLDPMPMIQGIENAERALIYWNESHRCGASERVKDEIQDRMQTLR